MSEAPQTAPPSRGSSHRGRGGRGGRGYRGGPRRGGPRGNGRPNTTDAAPPAPAEAPVAVPEPRIEPASVPTESTRDVHSGRSRGDRGRRGGGPRRGRGGVSNQRSVVVSHRGRGPPQPQPLPQAEGPAPSHSHPAGLNAVAAEFVPGQPVQTAPPPKPKQSVPRPAPRRATKSTAEDLPTRIHEDINNGQYECVICTGEVVRSSRVWSCSICWTVAHLHCVKKWHTNQMKKQEEEQNQNQDANQTPSWRCPGCNSSLVEKPGPHRCWCGKETDPRPIPGLPPHTCGQTCSKTRATCPHPCPLMCHAGPCPPCTLMGPMQTCYCGKHTSTKRCIETDYGKGFSCNEICGDLLPCGEHECSQPCHTGLCGACEVPVVATCYCGKEQRRIPCEQRDEILESFNYGQVKALESADELEEGEYFEGSFNCKKVCGRPLDCGCHTCQKNCHPQDEEAAHCPLSPDVVTSCPCGKTPLTSLTAEPRTSCQDSIPHCDKACNKTLPCGHACPQNCHDGPCPDCEQIVDISCRCGRTTEEINCHEGTSEQPQCTRICKVQRNCGRHECGTACCPGEKKAAERKRQQKKTADNNINTDNFEAEHICLKVCGRQLKCGTHTCQQLCHRGPCPSCPEAIFDEIACSCGRTVLQPPQPCGTRPPECRFPCRRARPCGHPAVAHHCHPDDINCPKCPFLVEKACICGKKTLKNQPCWFDEVRCGLPCGKKLKCGAHECMKPCHRPGECEDAGIQGSHCSQLCGKVRKSCEHTCQEQCHAPFLCKEDKPCPSKTFITCPCQNRKQEVRCLATKLNPRSPLTGESSSPPSSSSPSPSISSSTSSPSLSQPTSLKCSEECLRLQRNARLASALNIDPASHTDDHNPYSETTLKLYAQNIPWAQAQEREFRVFASDDSGEKRMRFKPMAAHQRAFIHSLAEDYGLDSESQDPEPHRHVCVFKTPRFVGAPRKTVGQCVRAPVAGSGGSKSVGGAASALVAKQKELQKEQIVALPFNGLLLREPRFGLTGDELEEAVGGDLKGLSMLQVGRLMVPVSFTTKFLPSDEIVIVASLESSSSVPPMTGTATAPAVPTPTLTLSPSPQDKALEILLASLKTSIGRTVSRLGLASNKVILCRVEGEPHNSSTMTITRREGDGSYGFTSVPGTSGSNPGGDKTTADKGGWSEVASRGGWRRGASGAGTATAPGVAGQKGGVGLGLGLGVGRPAPSRSFVALLRKKKVVTPEPEVEDDWLVAAEKIDEGEGEGEGEAEVKVKGDVEDGDSGSGGEKEEGVAGDSGGEKEAVDDASGGEKDTVDVDGSGEKDAVDGDGTGDGVQALEIVSTVEECT